MGSPFPLVIQNAREEALSADLNRAQALSSKALQDELMYGTVDATGVPISCFTKVPTLAGIAASFQVALGAGEAMVYDTSGLGVNDSAYKVVQWAAQNLTVVSPHATNPRIDLVVVTPATVQTDLATRNVLLNPTTRAFAPASVPKTQRPTAIPVVVTGTAGATPTPPAVPAGAFAMFEIYVPAAVADSTSFAFVPRMHRRAAYPFTGLSGFAPQCGVIRGCQLVYAAGFEAIGSGDNCVVIDGEVIEFSGISDNGNNDTLNNPFAVAAPVDADKPFYVYVVGGRNLPSSSVSSPVSLVASLTPPNVKTGRPSSAIGAPRGTTSSAVYIGIGFVQKNTTNHKICEMSDGYVWAKGVDQVFEIQNLVATGTVTLASAPTISSRARLRVAPTVSANTQALQLGTYWVKSYALFPSPGAPTQFDDADADIPIVSRQFVATLSVDSVLVQPVAFNVPVRRLG